MTITDHPSKSGLVLEFTIQDRLRKARLYYDAKMSQDDFAELIGASGGTVSNYELGITRPERMKNIYLRAWATVTGVDFNWLKFGDPKEPESSPSDYKARISRHEFWGPPSRRDSTHPRRNAA